MVGPLIRLQHLYLSDRLIIPSIDTISRTPRSLNPSVEVSAVTVESFFTKREPHSATLELSIGNGSGIREKLSAFSFPTATAMVERDHSTSRPVAARTN